ASMAMSKLPELQFDDIMAVNPSKTNGVYEVRVLKKWKAAYFLSSGGSSTVELVLIDKNLFLS
ncbi:hypothetical protein L195_g056429, partial [Trifolium pratense]